MQAVHWPLNSSGGSNGSLVGSRSRWESLISALVAVFLGCFRDYREVLAPGAREYNLHGDGERFAVLMAAEEQAEEKRDHVVLIQNFFELLRQEVGNQ